MRSLKVFLCEDEDISAKVNRLILLEHMKKKKISVDITYCSSYKEHKDELFKDIDLAILDIDLGDSILNGIELAKRMQIVNPCIVIIFITAYKDYALSAAQIHLSGFLEKPLNPHDFQDALNRAIIQVNGYRITNSNNRVATFQNNKITLKERSIISIVKLATTHEVEVITTEKKFRVYDSIKHVESSLSDDFVKLNRSVIVNLSYIFNIESDTVRMKGGTSYVVSTRYLKKVKKAYEEYVTRKLV